MLKEKLKALIVKEEGKDSKKKIENLVVFILILIVTVIAINSIWNGKKTESSKQNTGQDVTSKQLAIQDNNIETNSNHDTDISHNLETILSNINGVGKVKVLLSYSESSQVVAMYNENSKNSQVEEKDSGRRY